MSRVRNLQTEQALRLKSMLDRLDRMPATNFDLKVAMRARFLRELAPEVVEVRGPCEVCAPEPCKGHEVVQTTPGINMRITL